MIPHYVPIANLVQLAVHHRLNDPDCEDQRFRPGDICSAGGSSFHHFFCNVVNNVLQFFHCIIRDV